MSSTAVAEAIDGASQSGSFIVKQGGEDHTGHTNHPSHNGYYSHYSHTAQKQETTYSLANTTAERRYSKAVRDANGKIVRGYEGIDFKAVYERKSIVYKIVKRLFDIVASGLGLIILSPIFLITAIAIKLEDGGPVIYSGKRWGKDFK